MKRGMKMICKYRIKSPRGVATILGIFLLSILILVISMDRYVNPYDEGLILFGADRVFGGSIPHRDFYANYGPGQFYVIAALYKIFGTSVLIERVWDTLVRCTIVSLVFVITHQAAPYRLALLAAGASLVWLAEIRFYAYPIYPALATVLAAVVFLAPALTGRTSTFRLIAAGICAGAAFLFRYDIGIAAFGVQGAVLAIAAWCQHALGAGRSRQVVAKILPFGLGFIIVVGPLVAAFAALGVIPDLVFDVFIFPAQFYVKTRSLPFPLPWRPQDAVASAVVYFPLLACAAAVPTIAATMSFRAGKQSTVSIRGTQRLLPWMLVMLVALTLVFFAKGSVRVSTLHMGMALISSLALVALLAQPVAGRARFARALVLAAVLLGANITIGACLRLPFRAARNLDWAMAPASLAPSADTNVPAAGTCRMPAGLERLACFQVDADSVETIRYVQARTTPNEPVFIGLSRHDVIFVNDVLLYFIMNRKSATKWHHFDPGLQTSLPIQQEIVAELQHAQPKLIVLESRWANVREPNDSALSSGVTLLDDYLRQAYAPVAVFGPNTVLELQAARSAP